MEIERFIAILQTKECAEEERNEFMKMLTNQEKLFDIIVSHFNYENNIKEIAQYILNDLGEGINRLYCDTMTIKDYHEIVDTYDSANTLSKVFAAIDEHEYIIVCTENEEISTYDTVSEIITDFLIGIDFFSQIYEEDFALIIDEINDHDMFYSEIK